MESSILTDSSVLIELQRRNKSVIEEFSKIKDRILVSRITACELLYGSRNKKEREINLTFIKMLNILEVDKEVPLLTFNLIKKYGLKTKLGISDALLAASAISNKIPFWTVNIKHFNKINELDIFKPAKNPTQKHQK